MCEIVGIDIECIECNQENSGGGQYIIKNTNSDFWYKVYDDSNKLYDQMINYHNRFPINPGGIQFWTAEMWSLLWNLWISGKETRIIDELGFSWATDSIPIYNNKPILHMAGVTEDMKSVKFYKGDYININPLDLLRQDITHFDCLDKNLLTNYQNYFDYIVGNPPYVRIQNLGEDRRLKIQQDWHFCKNGSTDLFIAFFQIANKLLKKDGKLGFITPNTYLKTKTAISFRYFLQQQKNIECLIDFGDYQIFKNAITYSIITIINKKHKQDYFDYYKWQDNQLQFVEKINFKK
jgi:hypothetical protein